MMNEKEILEKADQMEVANNKEEEETENFLIKTAVLLEAEGLFEAQLSHEVSGNGDGSYPPGIEETHAGNVLFELVEPNDEYRRLETGYYYPWRVETVNRGLFMDPKGNFYGRIASGGGNFASFPAHPGNSSVNISYEYRPCYDVPVKKLREAKAMVMSCLNKKKSA